MVVLHRDSDAKHCSSSQQNRWLAFGQWMANIGAAEQSQLGPVPLSWPTQVSFMRVLRSRPSIQNLILCMYLCIYVGTRGSAFRWGTALQVGRSRVRFPIVSLEFFIDLILPTALWPWGSLSLWQKWVPGIFPGGKGGRCVGLTTLPPSCADCLEIWEPQPPGTLRACPGL